MTAPATKRLKTVPIADAFGRQALFQQGGDASRAITEALLFMIVKDGLPFNTPEKEGFKHFLKEYSKAGGMPLWRGISRQTVSRLIDAKYELYAAEVKKVLEKVEYLSRTSDIWTDTQTTKSYLGLTAHFLDMGSIDIVLC